MENTRVWVLMDGSTPRGIYDTAVRALEAKEMVLKERRKKIKDGSGTSKDLFTIRLVMFRPNAVPDNLILDWLPFEK